MEYLISVLELIVYPFSIVMLILTLIILMLIDVNFKNKEK